MKLIKEKFKFDKFDEKNHSIYVVRNGSGKRYHCLFNYYFYIPDGLDGISITRHGDQLLRSLDETSQKHKLQLH